MGLACVYRFVKNVFLFWLMIDIIGTIAIYIYGSHVIDEASDIFFYEILTNLTGASIVRAEDDQSASAIVDVLIAASDHDTLLQAEAEAASHVAGGLKPPPWPPPIGLNSSSPFSHPYYHHGAGGDGRHPPPPQIILDQMNNVIYEQDINALKYYAKAWLVAVLGQGLFYVSIGMIGVVTENRWVVLAYATICLIGDLINVARLQETVPLIVSFYINIAHTLLAFWFFLLLKRRPPMPGTQGASEVQQQDQSQDTSQDHHHADDPE